MRPGDGGRFGELREQHHSPPFLPSPGPQPRNTLEAGEYTVENETNYLLLQAASSRAAVAGWGPWMQEVLVLLEQTQLHALTSVLCIPGAMMGGKGRHCLPGARLGLETFSLLRPATCPGCSACHNVPIYHPAVPSTPAGKPSSANPAQEQVEATSFSFSHSSHHNGTASGGA